MTSVSFPADLKPLLKRGSTLKENNLLPLRLLKRGLLLRKRIWAQGEQILSFQSRPLGKPALVAQLDVCPTSDQEVVGLTLAGSATFFRGVLIMKYFLRSLSPFL